MSANNKKTASTQKNNLVTVITKIVERVVESKMREILDEYVEAGAFGGTRQSPTKIAELKESLAILQHQLSQLAGEPGGGGLEVMSEAPASSSFDEIARRTMMSERSSYLNEGVKTQIAANYFGNDGYGGAGFDNSSSQSSTMKNNESPMQTQLINQKLRQIKQINMAKGGGDDFMDMIMDTRLSGDEG